MPSFKILLILVVIVGIAAAGFYVITSKQQEDTSTVINGPASSTPPSQSKVKAYVRENISTLSPEPEQLGGTFFVTSISTSNGNMGVAEYEDGHNAYTADFTYSKNKAGEVVIDSFVVRD